MSHCFFRNLLILLQKLQFYCEKEQLLAEQLNLKIEEFQTLEIGASGLCKIIGQLQDEIRMQKNQEVESKEIIRLAKEEVDQLEAIWVKSSRQLELLQQENETLQVFLRKRGKSKS